MKTWDVVVAGAGPAGATAAHILARDGHQVLFADGASDAVKAGEAIPGAAVRLLRALALERAVLETPHSTIGGNLSVWNSDTPTNTDFICSPDGPGFRLDRLRFDIELRKAAARSGAVFLPQNLTKLARDPTCWTLLFANGMTARARWLIDATGRRAWIARRAGARLLRDTALVALYATAAPNSGIEVDRTIIEAVRNGWWYAARLPTGESIAGLHMAPSDARRMIGDPAAFRDALNETSFIRHLFDRARSFGSLRVFAARGTYLDVCHGSSWVACGDAAISFDPLSGQGIFSALHGGMAAARTVQCAEKGDESALRTYAQQRRAIREIYRIRVTDAYRQENRWPEAAFWSRYRSHENQFR
jgi:flavin-dependent dehydrogenase